MRLAKLCVVTCLVAVTLATYTRTFVLQPFHVPSASMEPTLLVGDHLLVNKSIYRASTRRWWSALLPSRPVRRGDVVIFERSGSVDRFVVKRCIGLPGETVELRGHQVFIDGQKIEDDSGYVHQATTDDHGESFGPIALGRGELFVLGDHRDRSRDSRTLGPIPESALVGRAVVVYWSTGHTGEVDQAGSWGKIGSLIKARFTQTRWRRTGTVVR